MLLGNDRVTIDGKQVARVKKGASARHPHHEKGARFPGISISRIPIIYQQAPIIININCYYYYKTTVSLTTFLFATHGIFCAFVFSAQFDLAPVDVPASALPSGSVIHLKSFKTNKNVQILQDGTIRALGGKGTCDMKLHMLVTYPEKILCYWSEFGFVGTSNDFQPFYTLHFWLPCRF